MAAAVTIAAIALGSAADALEYDRSAVASGEWWRPFTGQFVHWTPRMAWIDLGAFLTLAAALEWRSRTLAVATLVAAALVIGAGIHFLLAELARYRGSSGLACAFFVAVAADLAFARGTNGTRGLRWLAIAALLAFAAKSTWELATPSSSFVGNLPSGVTVSPAVHLLGGLAGFAVVAIAAIRAKRMAPRSEATARS